MATYGFLGMGIMGQAMAGNLLNSGNTVHIWNRTSIRCQSLAESGALVRTSPAEVIASCDITFAMVSDPAASREIFFGEKGVLTSLAPGKSYIDASTIDPETSIEISDAVRTEGGRFLEAPVSGSKKPAIDGMLVFLCAGDESLYREAEPAFQSMGKRSFYLGAVGRGARTKLVNNMIMGIMTVALSEGLTLAEKSGLDPAEMLDVLSEGAVANPMFALKGPLMLSGDFSPAFPLKHMEKDMRLALKMGKSHSQSLPAAAVAQSAFARALDYGLADKDFSSVLQAVQGDETS